MDNSDTLGILQQLERGEINANEADARLNAPTVERNYDPRFEETDAPSWVRRLWVYPLIAGLLLVGLGAWIIVATVHANILWFLLGLPIVLLGAVVLSIAASARSGHWLYVNVKEAGRRGHTFRFGIPLPLDLARVGLWIARWFVPRTRFRVGKASRIFDQWDDVNEILDVLERELNERRGVMVDVDDNDEHVQVYIV